MILIVSTEMDLTTNEVIDWLRHYQQDYVRVNKEDNVAVEKISLRNGKVDTLQIHVTNRNLKIDLATISAYWYRKGNLVVEYPSPTTLDPALQDSLEDLLYRENYKMTEFIHLYLKTVNGIGCFFDDARNKLDHLMAASGMGLLVPDTLISSTKAPVIEFEGANEEIVTKAISEGLSFYTDDVKIFGYTSLIKGKSQVPENFFPTLFQKKIEKRYDLRIFYLDGKCYSSAVVSQNDSETEIDFRKYNLAKSNRIVPFQLPREIEEKLDKLMVKLNYRSGSIDMVYTKDKKYVFLEINPVGQFAQVSEPCNYHLEDRVAKHLITSANL